MIPVSAMVSRERINELNYTPMSGYLDSNAPSIEAEYSRYIDGDILGKLITQNFLKNRLGYKDNQIIIPVGRYGDAKSKYAEAGKVIKDPGDGSVTIRQRKITFEIKCVRINIANRYLGYSLESWKFSNVFTSPSKRARKTFDILIAIGLRTLGLENDDYWKHLKNLQTEFAKNGRNTLLDAQPHEERFLSLCCFFVIPNHETTLGKNSIHFNVRKLADSPYSKYQAWGDDPAGCKAVWNNALRAIYAASSVDAGTPASASGSERTEELTRCTPISGLLDSNAPSVKTEYFRYLDGDVFGKLIAKNLLKNRLGYKDNQIIIPVGRYGDAKIKYAEPGKVASDPGDGSVTIRQRKITFEIKFARINIANKYRGSSLESWKFANVITSPSKGESKPYDILIAIGLRTLGLENDDYWKHLKNLQMEFAKNDRNIFLDAQPHEERFLPLCCFFVIPKRELAFNNIHFNVGRITKSRYAQYQAWGDDPLRCKTVWKNALRATLCS